MNKLKLNDEVVVIAGSSKGKMGKVKWIDSSGKKVIVEGVNLKKRSVKPTQEMPDGGFLELERAIDRSNVMHYSVKDKKQSRIRIVGNADSKARELVTCGTRL